jgi:hypothetical protein
LPKSREEERQGNRIDRFFAGPGARADQWCHLMELANAWANGTGDRVAFEAALTEMTPTEEFHAYPGLQLMAALREHSVADDAHAAATLTRRVTRAILTRSFRQNEGDWDVHDDGEGATAYALHPAFTRTEAHRPYFEVRSSPVPQPHSGQASQPSGAAFADPLMPSSTSVAGGRREHHGHRHFDPRYQGARAGSGLCGRVRHQHL